MENKANEQTNVISAQTAAAEKEKGATMTEVSLGKFKDANALLEAYNSLQSEFTKRCQKIKELEAKAEEADKTSVPAEPKAQGEKTVTEEEILKKYLLDVIGSKAEAVILDGVGTGLKTPVSRPKTIDEAGKLAAEFLAK